MEHKMRSTIGEVICTKKNKKKKKTPYNNRMGWLQSVRQTEKATE